MPIKQSAKEGAHIFWLFLLIMKSYIFIFQKHFWCLFFIAKKILRTPETYSVTIFDAKKMVELETIEWAWSSCWYMNYWRQIKWLGNLCSNRGVLGWKSSCQPINRRKVIFFYLRAPTHLQFIRNQIAVFEMLFLLLVIEKKRFTIKLRTIYRKLVDTPSALFLVRKFIVTFTFKHFAFVV